MAVAVAIAGSLMGVFFSIQHAANQRNAVSDVTNLYTRIDDAISAFAQLNGRLPCPSSNDAGEENCNGAISGQVPYVTIGVPNYEAASITYTIAPYTASDGTSVDLRKTTTPSVLQFEMSNQPTASISPLSAPAQNGRDYRLLGLCEALVRPRSAKNGDASAFTLSRVAISTGFGFIPGHSVAVDDLAARLSCGGLVSTAARGYFNTVAIFASALRNFQDYYNFDAIALDNANDDYVYGLFLATTTGPLKVDVKKAQAQQAAAACLVDTSKCSMVGFAATDLATESAYEALNVLKLVRYILNNNYATENLSTITSIVVEAAAQLDAVRIRALNSASGGVYAP